MGREMPSKQEGILSCGGERDVGSEKRLTSRVAPAAGPLVLPAACLLISGLRQRGCRASTFSCPGAWASACSGFSFWPPLWCLWRPLTAI